MKIKIKSVELYQGAFYDLLNLQSESKLDFKAISSRCLGSNFIEIKLENQSDLKRVLKIIKKNRSNASNYTNTRSSRSHAIFEVSCYFLINEEKKYESSTKESIQRKNIPRLSIQNSKNRKRKSTSKPSPLNSKRSSLPKSILVSPNVHKMKENCFQTCFTLIDLAGSERNKDKDPKSIRFRESREINSSLSALRRCFQSLHNGEFVPFKDSKLTFFLRRFFRSNSSICILINISAQSEFIRQTALALEYGSLVKSINLSRAKIVNRLSEQVESARASNKLKRSRNNSLKLKLINQREKRILDSNEKADDVDLKLEFEVAGFKAFREKLIRKCLRKKTKALNELQVKLKNNNFYEENKECKNEAKSIFITFKDSKKEKVFHFFEKEIKKKVKGTEILKIHLEKKNLEIKINEINKIKKEYNLDFRNFFLSFSNVLKSTQKLKFRLKTFFFKMKVVFFFN